MEREIKFKAKCPRSGKWIEGDLLHRITDTCIAVKDMDDIAYYPVDPSTVCQYTGRNAENDVPIYEGDIVECTYFNEQGDDTRVIGTISWEPDVWGYVLKGYKFENPSIGAHYVGEEYISLPCTDDTESLIKVIGSKFDKEEKE